MYHHLATQILARERIEQMLKEAEQDRLLRSTKGPRESQKWLSPVVQAFRSLLCILTPCSEAGSAA